MRPVAPAVALALVLVAGIARPAAAAEPARLYVTNLGGNTISVVDGRALTVVRTLPAAADPHFVVATPDGKRL